MKNDQPGGSASNSTALLAEVVAAVDAEEELDGDMPEHLWVELRAMNKGQMTNFLRGTINRTKENIKARILTANAQGQTRPDENSTQWQPSETAPKHGGNFIAYDPFAGILYTMHWDDDEFLTDNEKWSGNFTHWMPSILSPNA